MPRLKRGAELKLERLTPAAVEGGWSITRLAQEAGVGWGAASRSLKRFQAAMHELEALKPETMTEKRRLEARKAHDGALSRLNRLGSLLDDSLHRMEAKRQNSALAAREVAVLVKAFADYWRIVEAVFGLDVAKAITIRQQSQMPKTAACASWEGCATLEAVPISADFRD